MFSGSVAGAWWKSKGFEWGGGWNDPRPRVQFTRIRDLLFVGKSSLPVFRFGAIEFSELESAITV